jgi:membrane protein required for colicin V production
MDFALVLDSVVIIIILISSIVAFLRGFVREVLTILGLVGASMSALVFGPKVSPSIEKWLTADILPENLETEKLWGFIPFDIAASVFGYAGMFIITMILLSIVSHYVAKAVQAMGLGPVDRSMGVVFGAVRGFILVGLLYMPFHILMETKDKDEWFSTSHTFTYVEYTSEALMGFMPESWKRAPEEEKVEEPLDPLKELTTEPKTDEPKNTEEVAPVLETKPEDTPKSQEKMTTGKAIDVLIENQDRIKSLIEGKPASE